MKSSDARVGRAIATGTYELTIGDLATVLVLAGHRGPRGDIGDELIERCWIELARVSRDTAATAWQAALIDGVPPESMQIIDRIVHPESPNQKET